jgi:nifR3 family TIM-barrel protein
MADVTDAAFRRIIAKYSKGEGSAFGAMWTEFVSADGLALAPEEGRKKLLADLIFTGAERPVVAQFFSSRPENMEKAAALARELGFDGVDINMGCPDRSIEKQGAGAAHIKDPERAQEVIKAAKRGAGSLPVSVKTRIGYNKEQIDEWVPRLLETGIAALTVHLRTRKEMSKVDAHWEHMPRIVALRDSLAPGTRILGNGDALDIADARRKAEETGADGIMLGRAIFGNPWLFSHSAECENIGIAGKLRVMVEHTKLFEELFVDPATSGVHKNFAIMKKHYKAYVRDFDGASELRAKLMEAPDAKTIGDITEAFIRDTVSA